MQVWNYKASNWHITCHLSTQLEISVGFEYFSLSGCCLVKRDSSFDVHELVRSKASHGKVHVSKAALAAGETVGRRIRAPGLTSVCRAAQVVVAPGGHRGVAVLGGYGVSEG